MDNSLKGALEEVRQKFQNISSKELKHSIKEVFDTNENKTKYGYIEPLLDDILSKVTDITKTHFTKLAKDAWHRKYPEGRNKKSNAYLDFLKVELPKLKAKYPGFTNSERMKQASILWKHEKEQIQNKKMEVDDTTSMETSISINPKRKTEKATPPGSPNNRRLLRKRTE
jgi:hypothetical protein